MWRWTKRAAISLAGLILLALLAGAAYQSIATRRDLARVRRQVVWLTSALTASTSGAPAQALTSGPDGRARQRSSAERAAGRSAATVVIRLPADPTALGQRL